MISSEVGVAEIIATVRDGLVVFDASVSRRGSSYAGDYFSTFKVHFFILLKVSRSARDAKSE